MQFWFLLSWLLMLMALFTGAFFITPAIPRRHSIALVIAVATIARTVPIIVYPESKGLWVIDVDNFERAAQAVLDGRNIYADGGFVHPYFPLHMYTLAAMKLMANATGLPFFVWMRVPQAAAEVAIAALLVVASRRLWDDERIALRNGLLFAVCPLAVAATVYHGQFDSISALFALLAVFLLLRSPARADVSALSLGIGVLMKLWPAVLVPVLVARLTTWTSRVRYVLIAGFVVLAAIIVHVILFGSSWDDMRREVLLYETPVPRGGGIVQALDHLANVFPRLDSITELWIDHGIWPAAIGLVLMTFVVIARRLSPLDSTIAVLCTLFALAPDNGGYHYLWIVPFGIWACHSWPVAIIVLTTSIRYVAIGLVGGGAFLPSPVEGEAARWIVDHEWVFGVAAWVTFWVWGLWLVLRDPTTGSWSSSRTDFGVRI
jgi:hypothetical protein